MTDIFLLFILLGLSTQSAAQEVIGVVKNASDDRPIPTVHVLNLNKVLMSITDANGVFAIDAEINDTLYLSYLGFKSIKITVTNDLIKFPKTEFKLTALALALEEVIVRPYQLTGYLEIDAKNVPINRNQRYSILGCRLVDTRLGSRAIGFFKGCGINFQSF